jgi:hypothetical protein
MAALGVHRAGELEQCTSFMADCCGRPYCCTRTR